jgi:hypothetical protein
MRRRARLLLLLTLPALASAALTWEKREVRLTAPPGAKEVVTGFSFKNTGTFPITIQEIETDCECTLAELAKRTYAPGESGTIKAILSLGQRTGLQEHAITVLTDDPAVGEVELALGVEIPAVLTFSVRMLYWKVDSATDEGVIEVGPAGANRITRIELTEIKPAQAAKARVEIVQAGEKYRLFIQPQSTKTARITAVTFLATFANGTEYPFTVYAMVR